MTTSALSDFKPAAVKASCTSPKLSGVVITKISSSFTSISSAPASKATSMILSSKETSSKVISPRLVNMYATEPAVPKLPLVLEKQ
ncbi:hypothetical protein D3C75_1263030 [compost metagenome]